MATLTVQQVSKTGLDPSYAAAAGGGDEFANSGKVCLHVKNGGGSAQTVTVDSQTVCSHGFDHDVAVSVPAGGERFIGPFEPTRFNDGSGNGQITYTGVTSLTIAVLELP